MLRHAQATMLKPHSYNAQATTLELQCSDMLKLQCSNHIAHVIVTTLWSPYIPGTLAFIGQLITTLCSPYIPWHACMKWPLPHRALTRGCNNNTPPWPLHPFIFKECWLSISTNVPQLSHPESFLETPSKRVACLAMKVPQNSRLGVLRCSSMKWMLILKGIVSLFFK